MPVNITEFCPYINEGRTADNYQQLCFMLLGKIPVSCFFKIFPYGPKMKRRKRRKKIKEGFRWPPILSTLYFLT